MSTNLTGSPAGPIVRDSSGTGRPPEEVDIASIVTSSTALVRMAVRNSQGAELVGWYSVYTDCTSMGPADSPAAGLMPPLKLKRDRQFLLGIGRSSHVPVHGGQTGVIHGILGADIDSLFDGLGRLG